MCAIVQRLCHRFPGNRKAVIYKRFPFYPQIESQKKPVTGLASCAELNIVDGKRLKETPVRVKNMSMRIGQTSVFEFSPRWYFFDANAPPFNYPDCRPRLRICSTNLKLYESLRVNYERNYGRQTNPTSPIAGANGRRGVAKRETFEPVPTAGCGLCHCNDRSPFQLTAAVLMNSPRRRSVGRASVIGARLHWEF